jgi:membrane associated rhomboid family serine protease
MSRVRSNQYYEGGAGPQPFFDVAAAHVQADYFVRPSAPPIDDDESDQQADWRQHQAFITSSSSSASSSSSDVIEGAEMVEFQPSGSVSSSDDQLDTDADTRHLVKKKQIEDDDSDDPKAALARQGRPKPRGKVRLTEEKRKKRHQARNIEDEKQLHGWRRFVCCLWRWNQKKSKSPRAPTVYRPYFIIIMSIINVILLAAEIGVNKGIESLSTNPMVGPSAQTLLDMGAKYSPYMTDADGCWRFITPMFLHVGIIHLLFNLCSQLQMVTLERNYGCHRIIPIYFLSGVAGTLSSAIFVPNQIMVGASGAIFGLVGVVGVDLIQNWKRIKCPLLQMVVWVISVIVSLAFGLLPGIDNFAHLGGFVQGIIGACIFLPIVGKANSSSKGRWGLAIFCIPLDVMLLVGGFVAFYVGVNVYGWCSFCSWIDCVPILDWCDSYKD